MAGVYNLEITETTEELKQMLKIQKTASDKERIQLLYLLKTEQAKTVQDAAALLARNRVTLQKWLRLYRNGGLAEMLQHKPHTGRRHSIPQWAQDALNKRLHESEGYFFYEFTHINSNCFQVFLTLVSERYQDSVIIMQLDQAGAHRAKQLKIPDNIILIFQPSHSPQTNPIERVWQHLKLGLRWKLPKNLDELRA